MDLKTIEYTKIFPREFRKIIESCDLLKKEIAEKCGIPQKRFYSIVSLKGSEQTNKIEFESIRKFCLEQNKK
jgi:predicted transcriptional regulator